MNVYGFFPANMSYYDQQPCSQSITPGYTLRKSRVNQYGQGGGWMVIAPNGRMVKPKKRDKEGCKKWIKRMS